jgi:hypothetical protein
VPDPDDDTWYRNPKPESQLAPCVGGNGNGDRHDGRLRIEIRLSDEALVLAESNRRHEQKYLISFSWPVAADGVDHAIGASPSTGAEQFAIS